MNFNASFRARFTLWCTLSLSTILLLVLMSGAASAQENPRSDLQGGIKDKPYLAGLGGRVMVGGYLDMEFEWTEGGDNTFDQHRFIPFITGYVSDRVTVSAEIEFEHGGKISSDGGDGEIKLEYAVMDFEFSEVFNFRGGVILSPLGSFNILHDSPLNDLTDRPVVTRQLIPSTLMEAGMGFFGNRAVGEEGALSYEAYLVNGFDEGIIDGNGRLRVRGGRGSAKADNNQSKAVTARLGYSPVLGTNVGLSVHSGKYDSNDELGLTITALDARTVFGPLEIQGEAAMVSADIDRDLHPTAAESQRGMYAQANYHILHDQLMAGSVVTLVVRGDWIDYDTDRQGDAEDGMALGVNFRPTEETVFKMDYKWSWNTAVEGEREKGDGRFFFSFASYF
jgi:hypothetical protein